NAYFVVITSVLLLFSVSSYGQPWSGILAPDRAADWSRVGIPGGIPKRDTICANISAGTSTAAIQSTINNCPANQVVMFGAGTFNLSGAGLHSNKGIVLRGQGPSKTTVVLNGENLFFGSTGTGWLGGVPS